MRDIVLVPTYGRAEYLTLCLENLAAATGAIEKEVWISHDRHHNDAGAVIGESERSRPVAENFAGAFRKVDFQVRAPHSFVGNSYNCLELYKAAASLSDVRYIYLVEDDVLVSSDFFSWHEAVQARGDYFATVGWQCFRNPAFKLTDDPTGYIETNKDFASIGVCWRREKLAPFLRHATPEYYRNPTVYLPQNFPKSQHGTGWSEQDGIITRMLEETNDRWLAWPSLPRCVHVGISGYHRPQGYRFAGDVVDRVKALKRVISVPGELARLSRDPFNDVGSLSDARAWRPEDLHVTQRLGAL